MNVKQCDICKKQVGKTVTELKFEFVTDKKVAEQDSTYTETIDICPLCIKIAIQAKLKYWARNGRYNKIKEMYKIFKD